MKQSLTSVIAICAAVSFAAPALADCQQEIDQLRGEVQSGDTEGISKDGSTAPLETEGSDGSDEDASAGDSATAEGDDGGDGIAKDGSETPLDTDTSSVATSGQDAERQQDGDAASADASATGSMSVEAQDALARAEAALAAGDEAGCMEAVEEARDL